MIKKIYLKLNKIFTRKKCKEEVVKMFDNMEQELTICLNKIDKNISDILLCESMIGNIKLKLSKHKKDLIN